MTQVGNNITINTHTHTHTHTHTYIYIYIPWALLPEKKPILKKNCSINNNNYSNFETIT